MARRSQVSTFVAVATAAMLVALVWGLSVTSTTAPTGYVPRVGDVIFQALPRNELVDVIEGTTGSPFSHCGLVARRGDELVVLEALGEVRETPLTHFMRRGRVGAFTAARFDERWDDQIDAVIASARSHLGKPYDIRYDWDDEAIYCSELIVKAFEEATGEELGRRETLGELDWQNYEEFIRSMEDGALPLERVMVTPIALAEALDVVWESGW